MASKYNGELYCLNYLAFFKTRTALASHKNICKEHDFCNVIMSDKKY